MPDIFFPSHFNIWNRDRLYEIMDFGTYMYVLVCTEYIMAYWYDMPKMVHTCMYRYVLSLYRYYDMFDCHEVWHCFRI